MPPLHVSASSSSLPMTATAVDSKPVADASLFKLKLLAGIVLQTSASILVGRYTRSSVPPRELYEVNHLILTTEVCKLALSLALEHVASGGRLRANLRRARPGDALKILVPALLYLFQNSLLYVALSNLTAPLFQVTNQAKLVTTALVSVVMLGRRYTPRQWACLVGLSVGVAIVVLGEQQQQQQQQQQQHGGVSDTEEDAEVAEAVGNPDGATQNTALGLVSVSVACLSSALAGVYFEKVVKSSSNNNGNNAPSVSVWMRNIQLAFFTILLAGLHGWWNSGSPAEPCFMTEDGVRIELEFEEESKPYFFGFTKYVWLLVLLQAGGGLLVAAVIKYADNVLKGLATGVSVCLSTAVSTMVWNTPLTKEFSAGAALILSCVYLFSTGGVPASTKQPPPHISSSNQKRSSDLPPDDDEESSCHSSGSSSSSSRDDDRPFLTERRSMEA